MADVDEELKVRCSVEQNKLEIGSLIMEWQISFARFKKEVSFRYSAVIAFTFE